MMTEVMMGLAAATALASGAPDTSRQIIASTSGGQVAGRQAGDIASWLGIPYAAPPIGPLRWRAPQQPVKWTGIRDASAYAPACPQALVAPTQLSPLGEISEDCLYLNIWAPAGAATAKLPVMVWIHGGGFIAGTGAEAEYNGTHLAEQGVVVVTINYRLGRLGFFAHPALDREHPDEPKGNYGLQDQIAALRWVRDNIGAFGGDPERVTLFGESAGGISTLMLMAAPDARGLFQQAIVQSGAVLLDPRDRVRDQTGKNSATRQGTDWAASQGIPANNADAAERLRALPVEAIAPSAPSPLEAMNQVMTGGPMIDGRTIPETPLSVFRDGREAHVPLIIGYNSAEGVVWSFGNQLSITPITPITASSVLARVAEPANRDRIDLAIAQSSDNDPRRHDALLVSDGFFGAPTIEIALAHARNAPVWLYHFDAIPSPARSTYPATPHATEIFYAFGTLDRFRHRPEAIATDDRDLSRTMTRSWAGFAARGTPEQSGGERWPAFTAVAPTIRRLAVSGDTLLPNEHVAALRMIMTASDRSPAKDKL